MPGHLYLASCKMSKQRVLMDMTDMPFLHFCILHTHVHACNLDNNVHIHSISHILKIVGRFLWLKVGVILPKVRYESTLYIEVAMV